LSEIKEGITKTDKDYTDLKTGVQKLQDENERLQADFNKLQRLYVARQSASNRSSQIPPGLVSDECAAYLGSTFILQCAKSGKSELLSQSAATRDALLNSARHTLGSEVRTAPTTTHIPLPSGYIAELR